MSGVLKGRALWVALAALVAAALTARLGAWQLDRAAQKEALQQARQAQRARPPLGLAELASDPATAATQRHRAVVLDGDWLGGLTIYLDNRQMNQRQGFVAVTPLRLDDGSAVLVQRGWTPRDFRDRTRVAAAPAPAGRVRVQGRIATAVPRLYEFDGAASGPIRQNLDIESFARETALPLRPLTVVQEDGSDPPPDGLLRQWPEPAAGVQTHYGYAFQWFALSALVIGLYAWYQLIRPRRRRRA